MSRGPFLHSKPDRLLLADLHWDRDSDRLVAVEDVAGHLGLAGRTDLRGAAVAAPLSSFLVAVGRRRTAQGRPGRERPSRTAAALQRATSAPTDLASKTAAYSLGDAWGNHGPDRYAALFCRPTKFASFRHPPRNAHQAFLNDLPPTWATPPLTPCFTMGSATILDHETGSHA